MSLQNAQAEFAENLFSEDEQHHIAHPHENMLIYKNNIESTLIKTLCDIYPMINRLVGEDFFQTIANEYVYQYPSRSSNLHDYGEYFSDFLAHHTALSALNYLPEVASVEWACHQLHFAADHERLDIQRLEGLSDEEYNHLHFILHPASYLIKCHYPLLRIAALCKDEKLEQINLDEGGINLLIIRPEFDVVMIPLTEAEYIFLTALQENETLANALENTLHIDSSFNLEEKLPFWIAHKIIVDFTSIHG